MTMYQLDPDVVRWGLHLIDVCSLSNDGSPQTLTCYEKDFSQTKLVKEGFCNPTHSFVENDEVIAHALQEELSRVAAADASGFTSAGEQPQKELILAQDWLGPSGRDLSSGFHSNEEEVGEKEEVSSHLKELSLEGEYGYVLPEIEDESVLDGELGKRLNQMVPIPHVPKINGEIPSADEATSDHQRLLNRLQLYELAELKILGDGNCQFRSLSDQIYRSQEHHKFVRDQVVNQLKSHPELYDNYVPMAYGDYLKQMSKSGEWGDHVTLQAAADCYGIKIFVITSFKDTCYTEILPQIQKSNRIIFLSFWAEVHYNSIYPLGELPVVEGKKKKRWWRT
ncbi:UNVERIFIED_CONTAM: OVARIAN TUMOR DOMAIN-containing deubiquitinating enzyme 9 [Sesamum latifolium]|uniref:ubiquitinyl hydrolase 1 n=1 Tax=Sesamum latifolium TaxID=2727402 RepID=A0AAW2TC75_9LAMI